MQAGDGPPRLNRNLNRLQAIATDAQAALALTTESVLHRLDLSTEQSGALGRLRWVATDRVACELDREWGEPVSLPRG